MILFSTWGTWITVRIANTIAVAVKNGAKIRDHKIAMLPSEIFARQVFTTYEDEKLGVELHGEANIFRNRSGAPYSKDTLGDDFRDVREAELFCSPAGSEA